MSTEGKYKDSINERFGSVSDILMVPTPQAWVEWAVDNQTALLWDHANCEKKAASTALSLMFRYPQNNELVFRMSRLAREELRHFEQVRKIIEQRMLNYVVVTAPRYAARLRSCVRSHEPDRLTDLLVVGAFIEARSCERFGALVPVLDETLARFYRGLMESEARHFQDYLTLAAQGSDTDNLMERIALIGEVEAAAITETHESFAFHSGPPA